MAHRKREPSPRRPAPTRPGPAAPRIIGGRLRGRKLLYSGDPRTRPMKDRVREAIFNLLGPAVKQCLAVDLFAGTGALGLEAISRGAAGGVFIEQHYPTAAILRRNVEVLQLEPACELVVANTFAWFRRGPQLGSDRWVVFCSPPYDFYVSRTDEMLQLISGLLAASPPRSVLVVEADERFDFAQLPDATHWDRRVYPPAVVGIYWKT